MRAGDPETNTIQIPIEVYDAESAAVVDAGENYIATDVQLERDSTPTMTVDTGFAKSADPTVHIEIQGTMGEMEMPFRGTSEVMKPDPDAWPQAAEIVERGTDELVSARERFDGCNRLVLGTPQMKALNTWLHGTEDTPSSLAEVFGVREVIGVPGPMIHAVKPNGVVLDD